MIFFSCLIVKHKRFLNKKHTLKIKGKCVEPNPCSGAFDLGLLVPSSNNSTSKQFDILKNSLSEIVGRLRVNQNQVHVGYMQYSQRVKTFTSVRQREQTGLSSLIDRLQDIFYVPFEFSPVEDALKKSVVEIFRDSGRNYVVPRVAVLINDAASNPKVDLAPSAQQLANQKIEVIALGIGDGVDLEELNVATNGKQNNIIRLTGYEKLYENLDVIVQKICSLNAEIGLGQVYYQRLGRSDYRYFKTSLVNVKTGFIEIQVEELLANNKVNCYYSFDVKNPVKETSGKVVTTRQTTNKSTKFATNHYLIHVPIGKTEIYFTLESLDKNAEVNIMVQEIDF